MTACGAVDRAEDRLGILGRLDGKDVSAMGGE